MYHPKIYTKPRRCGARGRLEVDTKWLSSQNHPPNVVLTELYSDENFDTFLSYRSRRRVLPLSNPFIVQCWCGEATDDPTILGSATCTRTCLGDKSQICGGVFAMSVYEYEYTSLQ